MPYSSCVCRPLNAQMLGQWNSAIQRGACTTVSFPTALKLPPVANGYQRRTSSQQPAVTASPKQTGVTIVQQLRGGHYLRAKPHHPA